jgi:hypothetical protein
MKSTCVDCFIPPHVPYSRRPVQQMRVCLFSTEKINTYDRESKQKMSPTSYEAREKGQKDIQLTFTGDAGGEGGGVAVRKFIAHPFSPDCRLLTTYIRSENAHS